MDTRELVDQMKVQKGAMTAATAERHAEDARRRWAALGGSETGLAKVNAGQFMSMNAAQQEQMVKSIMGVTNE